MRLSFVDECVEVKKKERRKEGREKDGSWVGTFFRSSHLNFFSIVRCQKMIIIFISSSGSSFAHFYYDE